MGRSTSSLASAGLSALLLIGIAIGMVEQPWIASAIAAPADLNAAARASVAQALYAASATSAAAERHSDERLAELRRRIESLETRLRTASNRNAQVVAELAQAQEGFVAQLAERDRAYAREIAVFRRAVEDIASTPEGERALRQFNAGDELGALSVLDRLRAARDAARQARANIESAAEGRRIAKLALETRARGKLDTSAVIARYEEVTRLDPGEHWDWVELGRLYADRGRLGDAKQAAQQAAVTAAGDRDRSVALDALANVLVAQGDLAAARRLYQESLDIDKRLAAADPSSAERQRDVSVSLVKLGDVLVAQGDLAAARRLYQESLEIAKRLAAADPSSAARQRDAWSSMWRLTRFPDSGITWQQVVSVMEDMHRRGVLAPPDVRYLEDARRQAAAGATR